MKFLDSGLVVSAHRALYGLSYPVSLIRQPSASRPPTYSRRQNKVSVPFALHGERSENGDITVEKTVSKTVVKRYLNGAKTVTRKTEAVKILRDRTCCPRGSRSIVCTSKAEEHSGSAKGATGKL